MAIRYMGTKRVLAPFVREAILRLGAQGLVADGFSGMGSVAAAMASDAHVVTNDLLSFTAAFARARFLEQQHRRPGGEVISSLAGAFTARREALRDEQRARLRSETAAIDDGPDALRAFMADAPHVGNDPSYALAAQAASGASDESRYRLCLLYFASGYFSTSQAIDLDALRNAIDQAPTAEQDWLLAAWLAAAATVVNAPGHVAQFLKPRSDETLARIRRQWKRSVWEVFVEKLSSIQPIGSRQWRSGNEVLCGDVLDLLDAPVADKIGVVYVDPPYTTDHYSRYYHVYETLYRYDFPASTGIGRMRHDRVSTRFSLVTQVEEAFIELVDAVANKGLPLVVSYPSNGVLHERGIDVVDVLEERFAIKEQLVAELDHSTLGASTGSSTKAAVESIYVCV